MTYVPKKNTARQRTPRCSQNELSNFHADFYGSPKSDAKTLIIRHSWPSHTARPIVASNSTDAPFWCARTTPDIIAANRLLDSLLRRAGADFEPLQLVLG